MHCPPVVTQGASNSCAHQVDWIRANEDDIARYRRTCETLLCGLPLTTEALSCDGTDCRRHHQDIDAFYAKITECLQIASLRSIPTRSRGSSRYVVPGWNDYVKEFHESSRQAFLHWVAAGKPRQGDAHQQMKLTRARFKYMYALRSCRKREAEIRADKLAEELLHMNDKEFWQEVRSQAMRKVPLAEEIDGVRGEASIAEVWAGHYRDLFNCGTSARHNLEVERELSSTDPVAPFTPRLISEMAKKLKKHKSGGLDDLTSEHIIFAPWQLHVLLSMFFNSCIQHSYLPREFMRCVLIPILKSKSGDVTDTGNYRPVALTSTLSKLFELLLLERLECYLLTSDAQFGFKARHGTDMCIYVLKEVVQYFKSHSTPVFMCFMDASKAFDWVNQYTLFYKLLRRDVPGRFVKLLLFWYSSQQICVRWGNCTSSFFTVTNGVRQGGILSPTLYNVYVDDLSNLLNQCNVGCTVFNHCFNHLCYADDLVLMSPSAKGLQSLVNICASYAKVNDIIYNEKKTVIMICYPRSFNACDTPQILLNGSIIKHVDHIRYLGVILSHSFTDDLDLKRQLKFFYFKGNFLIRNFKSCSNAVKTKLFNAFCANFYCGHLWFSFNRTSFHATRVGFNNVIRKLLHLNHFCSASDMFASRHIKSFNEILRHCVYGFKQRLLDSRNVLISSTLRSALYFRGSIWNSWNSLLFSHHFNFVHHLPLLFFYFFFIFYGQLSEIKKSNHQINKKSVRD